MYLGIYIVLIVYLYISKLFYKVKILLIKMLILKAFWIKIIIFKTFNY